MDGKGTTEGCVRFREPTHTEQHDVRRFHRGTTWYQRNVFPYWNCFRFVQVRKMMSLPPYLDHRIRGDVLNLQTGEGDGT